MRCDECVDELVHAPEAWVRLAIISEPDPSPTVIDALVGDGDLAVNYTARWQRRHAGKHFDLPDHPPTRTRRQGDDGRIFRESSVERPIDAEPLVPAHHDDGDEW